MSISKTTSSNHVLATWIALLNMHDSVDKTHWPYIPPANVRNYANWRYVSLTRCTFVQIITVHRGGRAWLRGGGRAWQGGACVAGGGMRGRGGGGVRGRGGKLTWLGGACVAGGAVDHGRGAYHAWWGGVHCRVKPIQLGGAYCGNILFGGRYDYEKTIIRGGVRGFMYHKRRAKWVFSVTSRIQCPWYGQWALR